MRFFAATSTKDDINDAVQDICSQIGIKDNERQINLAYVFASPHHKEHYESVLSKFQDMFEPDAMIGCMGESIIGNKNELDSQPAITLWLAILPDVTINPFHLQYERSSEETLLANFANNLPVPENDLAFIVIAEPFSIDAAHFLSYMNKVYPKSPVIGGMASGAVSQGGNCLFYNGKVLNNGLIGVALNGSIKVHSVVSQGCRPIGESFIITKAERNIIHALGGKSALECYQEIYKSLDYEDKLLAQMGVNVGLVINEYLEKFDRGDFLVRNLMGVDESSGAISITDLVRVGQTAQFMVRDAKSAHDDLEYLLTQEKKNIIEPSVSGALIFSCNGRGLNLFPEPDHDVSCIKKIIGDIPTGGFFAQGEIGPVGGINFLHGFTASVAIFSELN